MTVLGTRQDPYLECRVLSFRVQSEVLGRIRSLSAGQQIHDHVEAQSTLHWAA